MAKLHIITIIRNRPKYFQLMTESMRRQTFQDFEWTIFDNKKNESLASITTRVFLDSTAELCGKIDDDILLEPDCIQRLVDAHNKYHFGYLGPFHFREEEMQGVEPKITEYNGVKIWERPHIGGNFVIRREDFKGYNGEGVMGLSDYQHESLHPNGYIFPFSIADHLQDARSKHHIPEYENKFGLGSADYLATFIRDSIPYLRAEYP
ncbi:MAG TPA: hypothetical protein VK255_02600 [Patescibacteria group bacterium]|nr:hypothetical protein [Patescibacteria group bacterium]